MNNFEYIQPKTLKEASQALGNDWQTVLPFAGGTDLLGLMKDEIESPNKLVNLKSIANLNNISYVSEKGLTIGALVTINEIAEHPLINEKYSALAQAAKEVASPQLRNVGTIGGNICQRPRCWYFRGDFHCLRKGGDICYAVDGRNKFHCVVGGGPCFIVYPSDTAVALTALDAKVVIFSDKKSRSIPIKNFFILPEVNVERENILKPGEIVTEVQIPDLPANTESSYLKLKERRAWDFAIVSVAAAIQKNGASFTSGSIVLGGVAPVPWFEKEVSAQLAGLNISAKNIEQLSNKALKGAEPLADNAYKVPLAQNMIKKILLKFS
jgi:xanthine dehydrogenase YagS FAD-binding subunit